MQDCTECDGKIDTFLELYPRTDLWICNKCHNVFIQDESDVFHKHKVKAFYPNIFRKARKELE